MILNTVRWARTLNNNDIDLMVVEIREEVILRVGILLLSICVE